MSNRQKGICCLVASAFGFAAMAFFVRLCDEVGAPVNTFQKSLFRNLIAFAIAAAVFAREPARARPAGARAWALLVARSVAGCVGIFGNFYALSRINIGEAMTLNKTAPFFAVLFAWIFLRERVTRRQLAGLVAAFAGALLVMKPGFQGAATFATVCALGGGLGAGVAYTCVRELGILRVNGALIVLFFSAFSTLASLPFFIAAPDPMTLGQVLVMVGAGCAAAVGQFGVTAAYRFAPPHEIAVFDYTNVIFTALFGFFFFAQVPDALSVAGFAVIVAAAVLSSRKSAFVNTHARNRE